jgi:hypothetical protein
VTIFQLAEQLPNGFHDSKVASIRIDYVARVVTMEVEVWVGTMDDPEETRETYRRGILTIRGFRYCAMDVPDKTYPYDEDALTIDLADATAFHSPGAAFSCRMWVNEWNGFIHLSAESAELSWIADPVNRRLA